MRNIAFYSKHLYQILHRYFIFYFANKDTLKNNLTNLRQYVFIAFMQIITQRLLISLFYIPKNLNRTQSRYALQYSVAQRPRINQLSIKTTHNSSHLATQKRWETRSAAQSMNCYQ